MSATLTLSRTNTRLVEVFPCGGGYRRIDVWTRTKRGAPYRDRRWVILSPEEWAVLRRYVRSRR